MHKALRIRDKNICTWEWSLHMEARGDGRLEWDARPLCVRARMRMLQAESEGVVERLRVLWCVCLSCVCVCVCVCARIWFSFQFDYVEFQLGRQRLTNLSS